MANPPRTMTVGIIITNDVTGVIMKIKALVQPQFFRSLNKIMVAEIPVTLAWRLKGLVKYLETSHKSYDEMRKEILTKHSEKDDKGEMVVDTAGNVQFKDDKAKEAFIKDHTELLEQDIEIEKKIKLAELSTMKMSASDLLVLEDLIEE